MKQYLLAAHLALLFLQMTFGHTSFEFWQLTGCRLDRPLATFAVKPQENQSRMLREPDHWNIQDQHPAIQQLTGYPRGE
jgi:hypothetical protein